MMEDDPEPVLDRALGCWLGLAVGDAVGTTLEFTKRDTGAPLADMVGGGPFDLAPGEWTDDTSMALCLADSLIACGGLDTRDLMNRFVNWYQHGHNSPTGACFDIGTTTRLALERFLANGNPQAGSTDPRFSGNGSIMRLAPVAVRWHQQPAEAVSAAREQSRTTHAAPAAVEACAYLAECLVEGIRTGDRDEALRPRATAEPSLLELAQGQWRRKSRDEIESSGYVVHTLEAALWSVHQCNRFDDAVLLAANLGDDTDTVAAVTGQIAGALWGMSAIPTRWLDRLAWRDRLIERGWALVAAAFQHEL